MTHDEEIAKLRAEGLTAKAIARKLGLSPSAVTQVIQKLAAAAPVTIGPVIGAWVSGHWTEGLGFAEKIAHWKRFDVADHDHPGAGGLVQVLVARAGRHDDAVVTGFVCDVWCLGVKGTLGPRTMKVDELERFGHRFFHHQHAGAGPISIDLAQAIVLGSEAYARSLGFEPHPDYAKVRQYLGADVAPEGIVFGRDGKPSYVPTPGDDEPAIRAKLAAKAG